MTISRRYFDEMGGTKRIAAEVILSALKDTQRYSRYRVLDAFLFLLGGGGLWGDVLDVDVPTVYTEYLMARKNIKRKQEVCLAQTAYVKAVENRPEEMSIQAFARALDASIAEHIKQKAEEISMIAEYENMQRK